MEEVDDIEIVAVGGEHEGAKRVSEHLRRVWDAKDYGDAACEGVGFGAVQ